VPLPPLLSVANITLVELQLVHQARFYQSSHVASRSTSACESKRSTADVIDHLFAYDLPRDFAG